LTHRPFQKHSRSKNYSSRRGHFWNHIYRKWCGCVGQTKGGHLPFSLFVGPLLEITPLPTVHRVIIWAMLINLTLIPLTTTDWSKVNRLIWANSSEFANCIQKVAAAAGCWWFMPVILASQEAEIRKIAVWSQPGKIVPWDPIRKNPSQK
jgi:hypothetical protein